MIPCPNCETLNHDTAKFCKVCGATLIVPVSEATTCPVCGKQLRAGARFCSYCGQPIAASPVTPLQTRSCPYCGAVLRSNACFCKSCGKSLLELEAVRLCPSCGGYLPADAHFCRICGAPIDGRDDQVFDAISSFPSLTGDKNSFGADGLSPIQVIAERYWVLERVAKGGMGAIYKAQDHRLNNKVVALKEISELSIAQEEREDIIASFTREAELLARLRHPNLVRVTDLLHEGTYHYMIMEFVIGQTLEQILNSCQRPVPEARVLVWAKQLCEVLFYLHNQDPPIIYRDIKPSNIMIVTDSEQIKLIDFGIARFYKPGKRKDTIQFGTDGYAPPEQYGSTQTDIRADVYALGAMLHQLLSLRDPQSKLFEFPPLRKLNPSISVRVEAAIQKAVEPLRENRHASMLEFWQALSGELLDPEEIFTPAVDAARLVEDSPYLESAPDHVETMPILPLGGISRGAAEIVRRVLVIPPGNAARVSTSAPWIDVQPESIEENGGPVEVSIRPHKLSIGHLQLEGNWLRRWWGWHTSRLAPIACEHQGLVVVHYDDDTIERYPISVTIQPGHLEAIFGWVLTIGLLVLEVVIPLGVLLILLSVIR